MRASTLRVPGAELAVFERGAPDAEVLVALHGGPGESHRALSPYLDPLADAYRLVYYDQRGGGGSRLEPGVSPGGVDEHVADLERLRVHLRCERIRLLGFSFGAELALRYALDHPERVERLVLVSPPALAGPDPNVEQRLQRAVARPDVEALASRLQAVIASGAAEEVERARFALRIAPVFFEPARALRLEPIQVDEAVRAAVERSVRAAPVAPRLSSLRGTRSLVLFGADDPISSGTASRLARMIGAEEVSLPACGHAPFVERPEPALSAVRRFLAS